MNIREKAISSVKQLVKFSIVGLMNTAITLGTIFILTRLFSVYYVTANIAGYTLGLINSFILNRKWTFKSNGHPVIESIKFLAVFFICYFLQLFFLILLKEKLGINQDFSQLIAMVFYTGLNFLFSKFFTFRKES